MSSAEVLLDRAVELWQKCKVDSAEFIFSCGGDSMNDTETILYNVNGHEFKKKTDELAELEELISEQVYKNVEFYEASDGHYQGEAGTVYIKLNDEGTDFEFTKDAQSEFNESYTEQIEFQLSQEEADFLKEYGSAIFADDGTSPEILYKKDLVMTDARTDLVADLLERVRVSASEYTFTDAEGEEMEFMQFFTGTDVGERDSLVVKDDNTISISITKTFLQYQPSENF